MTDPATRSDDGAEASRDEAHGIADAAAGRAGGDAEGKQFHLWRLLAWLLGVMVALMGVAAAVDVWVLGF